MWWAELIFFPELGACARRMWRRQLWSGYAGVLFFHHQWLCRTGVFFSVFVSIHDKWLIWAVLLLQQRWGDQEPWERGWKWHREDEAMSLLSWIGQIEGNSGRTRSSVCIHALKSSAAHLLSKRKLCRSLGRCVSTESLAHKPSTEVLSNTNLH